jgi:hypothetical protein
MAPSAANGTNRPRYCDRGRSFSETSFEFPRS